MFVHIGAKVPKHLVINLKRTIKLFPEHSVVLITLPKTIIPIISDLTKVDFLPNALYLNINSKLSHPKEFRDNFWANTLIRFLALHSYMVQIQQEFIHVESDVILSQDFPFDKFSSIEKSMAFPIVDSKQGIASVLYLKNVVAAEALINVIEFEIENNPQTTDMLVLKSLYDRAHHLVQILPTGPSTSKNFSGDENDKTLIEIRKSFKNVGGIIDGRNIGVYLFGDDPRNHRGKRINRLTLPDDYLNPRSLKFVYSPTREFIDVDASDCSIPIYSLHIHSKNLSLFKLGTSKKIMKRAVLKSSNPIDFDFIPYIFVNSLLESVARRLKLLRESYYG